MTNKVVNILLVEGDSYNAIIIAKHLDHFDEPVKVIISHTGEDAIEKLKSDIFDLCLIDLNLPSISGMELLHHIFIHYDNLPSIVMTEEGDEKTAVQAMKLGAYDYILKNELSQNLLTKTVSHTINNYKVRAKRAQLRRNLGDYSDKLEALVEERTKKINHLNNYQELILSSLDEFIRVVDPVNKIIEYESGRMVSIFGNNVGTSCQSFWGNNSKCDDCISNAAIDEWCTKNTEIVMKGKTYTMTSIPLKNMDGTVSTIEIIRDVTERKKVEAELKQKNKLAVLGEMSAYLAHEIRGPLNTVTLACEYLDDSSDVKGEDKKALENLGRGVDSLVALSTDLLNYSKNNNLNLEFIDPISMINNIIEDVKQLVSNNSDKNIEFKKQLPENMPKMYLDPIKIRQALYNVINNAIESMDGEGLLSFSGSKGDDSFFISIEDTGCGMTKEEQEQMFLPFLTFKEGGTGLGMAIVKHFIGLHGGDITVESEKGKGTIIVIALPLPGE